MKISRLPNRLPEIFHTLQGEGLSLGAPAVFLRLALCNLHCQWCDTPYTWNWEGSPWQHQDGRKFSKADQILELTPAEVAEIISRFSCDRLVLTGGEPLLQQAELIKLARLLPHVRHFEVETNGTQIPHQDFEDFPIQFNVSPKLSNSGMEEKLRLKPEALRHLAAHPDTVFKFVVCSQSDLAEVGEIRDSFGIPSNRIILMPEGRDPATLQKRSLWLADICRDHGYRFSPRLHVLLWGNKRAK